MNGDMRWLPLSEGKKMLEFISNSVAETVMSREFNYMDVREFGYKVKINRNGRDQIRDPNTMTRGAHYMLICRHLARPLVRTRGLRAHQTSTYSSLQVQIKDISMN